MGKCSVKMDKILVFSVKLLLYHIAYCFDELVIMLIESFVFAKKEINLHLLT